MARWCPFLSPDGISPPKCFKAVSPFQVFFHTGSFIYWLFLFLFWLGLTFLCSFLESSSFSFPFLFLAAVSDLDSLVYLFLLLRFYFIIIYIYFCLKSFVPTWTCYFLVIFITQCHSHMLQWPVNMGKKQQHASSPMHVFVMTDRPVPCYNEIIFSQLSPHGG